MKKIYLHCLEKNLLCYRQLPLEEEGNFHFILFSTEICMCYFYNLRKGYKISKSEE